MSKRACTATTKKGQPCKAAPLKDRDTCVAHCDEETRASMGFGPEAGKLGGRPRRKTADDFLAEWWAENEGTLLDVLSGALTAERAIVVATKDEAYVEYVTDHETRLKAFREALDRYFGRSKQQTEISGPDGGAILTAPVSLDAEHAEETLRILQHAQTGGNGNGNGSNGHSSGRH